MDVQYRPRPGDPVNMLYYDWFYCSIITDMANRLDALEAELAWMKRRKAHDELG